MDTIPSVTVPAMLTFCELSVSSQTKAGFPKIKNTAIQAIVCIFMEID